MRVLYLGGVFAFQNNRKKHKKNVGSGDVGCECDNQLWSASRRDKEYRGVVCGVSAVPGSHGGGLAEDTGHLQCGWKRRQRGEEFRTIEPFRIFREENWAFMGVCEHI